MEPLKNQEHDYLLKVTLIGSASTGKSSILLRYIDNSFEDSYSCTIGVDFKIKTLQIDGKRVKLQIWDTAGQERFKAITYCYFRGSHGSLIVFDLADRESFDNVKDWVKEFRDCNSPESGRNIVIVGNKVDLVDNRQVSNSEAQQLASKLNCQYLEVSAKTGENLPELFDQITRQILSSFKPEPVNDRQSSFNPVGIALKEPASAQPKKLCC